MSECRSRHIGQLRPTPPPECFRDRQVNETKTNLTPIGDSNDKNARAAQEKTTKVVVTPVNSNSTNRAASSSVNTNRPEKVKGERKEKVTVNNRAASAPKPTGLNPEKVKEVTKERKPKVKKEK